MTRLLALFFLATTVVFAQANQGELRLKVTDPAGLELLHRIGADRVMWSSDYPHQESTFGYTRSAIQAVFDATTVENAQLILGKTALDVFRMN